MSANAFRRLQALLPPPPLLVGLVQAHHDDDTSTVQLPGAGLIDRGANIYTGPVIRARGRTVPVGAKAFIRAGVIETRAPDGDVIDIEIGAAVAPAASGNIAPRRPSTPLVIDGSVGAAQASGLAATVTVATAPPPTYDLTTSGADVWEIRTQTADLQYLAAYGTGAAGAGGLLDLATAYADAGSLVIAADRRSVAFGPIGPNPADYYAEVFIDVCVGDLPVGRYVHELVIAQSEGIPDLYVGVRYVVSRSTVLYAVHQKGRFNPYMKRGDPAVAIPHLALGDVVGMVYRRDPQTTFWHLDAYVNGGQVGTMLLGSMGSTASQGAGFFTTFLGRLNPQTDPASFP